VGVIFRSPDGQHVITADSHHEAEGQIRQSGGSPADWTVELTQITKQVNPWSAYPADPAWRDWRVRLNP
jgi:hypothetical protein